MTSFNENQRKAIDLKNSVLTLLKVQSKFQKFDFLDEPALTGSLDYKYVFLYLSTSKQTHIVPSGFHLDKNYNYQIFILGKRKLFGIDFNDDENFRVYHVRHGDWEDEFLRLANDYKVIV